MSPLGRERFGKSLHQGDLRRAEGGEVLEHVPGLGLLEGAGVESPAADRGQERRLDQRRILGFCRDGQFQEVKSRWVAGGGHGPPFGGDVVSRFAQPPLLGLDRSEKIQIVQVDMSGRAFGQVPVLAGGEQPARVTRPGMESLAQVITGDAVHQ